MGATFCDVHNLTGSIYSCKHISEYFYRIALEKHGEVIPNFNFVIITKLKFSKKLRIPGTYGYCDLCSLNFKFYEKSFSDITHIIFNIVNIHRFIRDSLPVCIDCLFIEYFGVNEFDEKVLEANLNVQIKIQK